MVQPSPVLRPRSVAWATLSDPKGQNPKRRPVIILTAAHEIRPGGDIDGVAVSSTFPDPPPPECVELPWDPRGTAPTGFRRRCVAVCDWGVHVPFEQVEPTGKHVPPDTLRQILEQIARLAAKKKQSP